MLCWRFPRGGAHWQEPEPSSFLRGLVASWPSRSCSLARQPAPSSLGIGQGTLSLGQREGWQGGDSAGEGHRGHRERGKDLGWLVGRRNGMEI